MIQHVSYWDPYSIGGFICSIESHNQVQFLMLVESPDVIPLDMMSD